MKKVWIAVLLLFSQVFFTVTPAGVLASVLTTITGEQVVVTPWLSGWQYRKAHVINSASGAGINYQIRIKVHYGSGTDSGEDVYLNSHSRTDFGDMRFTDDNKTTLLDYWMESKVDGNYAIFWVEIADDLSDNPATIYIYYGKGDAATTSNGANTFLFFDDFSINTLSNYTETYDSGGAACFSYDSANKSVGASTTDGKQHHLTHNTSTVDNNKIGVLIISGKDGGVTFRFQDQNNSYVLVVGDNSSGLPIIGVFKRVAGILTEIYNITSISNDAGTAHQLHIGFYGQYLSVWWDGSLIIDSLDLGSDYSNGKFGPRLTDGTCYHDDLRVGKYVDPEPSHGSWGNEEVF